MNLQTAPNPIATIIQVIYSSGFEKCVKINSSKTVIISRQETTPNNRYCSSPMRERTKYRNYYKLDEYLVPFYERPFAANQSLAKLYGSTD